MFPIADAVKNNREKILTLPNDTILCPGHGPMTTVGEEKKHNPFLPLHDGQMSLVRSFASLRMTERYEHRIRWSWQDGREHGAPFEGARISRHGGLRRESASGDESRDGTG